MKENQNIFIKNGLNTKDGRNEEINRQSQKLWKGEKWIRFYVECACVEKRCRLLLHLISDWFLKRHFDFRYVFWENLISKYTFFNIWCYVGSNSVKAKVFVHWVKLTDFGENFLHRMEIFSMLAYIWLRVVWKAHPVDYSVVIGPVRACKALHSVGVSVRQRVWLKAEELKALLSFANRLVQHCL